MINFLYKQYEWVKIADLAKELNCSQRVLKDDLAYLKNLEKMFEIESSFKGIRIKFKNNKGLKSFYQAILAESNAFKLLELTLLNEYRTSHELATQLYMSESTLYRLMNELNTALKHHFDIEYSSAPFRLVGSEQKIRYFYYTYFSERYSKLEWPFPSIDESALDDLLNLFIKISDKSINFAYYANFKLIVTVNLFRYRANNLMNMSQSQTNLNEIIPDLTLYQDRFQSIEERLGIKLNLEAALELFSNFVRYDYSLSYDRLMKKAKNDTNLNKSITFLSNLMDKLSSNHHIELTNKEEIIWQVSNAAWGEGYESKSRYILYNRNQRSVTRLAAHFPDFFHDMSEGLSEYRGLIDKPLTPFTMDFIIYTFCTYWWKLIPSLQNKWHKVKLIIVSDINNGHANLMKDIIDYAFGNKIELLVYESPLLSYQQLKELNCDIVIANFPLPNYSEIQTAYVENIPSIRNLKTISDLVDRINLTNENRTYYMGI